MDNNLTCLQEIERISLEVFKTTDYKSMISILNKHDGMVKEFNRRVEQVLSRRGVI